MKILHYGQNGLFPLNIAPWSFAKHFLVGNDFSLVSVLQISFMNYPKETLEQEV